MKIKKLTILVLSIIMLISALPMYASAAETLTSSNVQTWPTVSYKCADGKMHFGQTIEEAMQLNDDEVVLNAAGEQVEGHFEFINPGQITFSAGTQRATITFIPADETAYSGFELKRCRYVTWMVTPCNPVFVDEVNDPVVATEVEPGALLSTSILSGGAMMNPYNPDESRIKSSTWNWANDVNPGYSTVVSESGYYTASLNVDGYERVLKQVYVKIASDIPETSIAEYPVIPELVYDPNVTWADIELTGGKAVVKGTDTEVAGKFAFKNLSWIPNISTKEIEIVFTPDDPEAALPNVFKIPVTVKPCPISFGPEYKGTSIDDPYILEVAPYADMGDVSYELKYNHLNWPHTGVAGFYNENTTAVNGQVYEYKVLNYNNDNYTGMAVYVKLVFATTEINPTIKSASGDNRFKVDCGTHNPPGTFTIFCNDVEIATARREESYVFDCEVYTDAGGTSHIVAKYNPVENDYFVCSDAEITITVPPVHTITNAHKDGGNRFYVETLVGEIRTGTPVELSASLDSFVYWIIKDADGKEVTLDGVDVNSKTISFLMPDCDLYVTYKTQYDIEREEAIANCKHMCHSDNEFVRLFWKFINFFNRLFNVNQYCECGEMHYSAPLFPIAKK